MLPEFSPLRLADELRALPDVDRLWVAYSGGLDSHVLLHALVSQFAPAALRLQAVHVDHGLASDAAAWARHCQRVCAALGVPLRRIRVNARPSKGESPEAAAREARYGALRSLLRGRECLLTAHHQDDQAETVLLQLLRGAGVRGLAAMPRLMPFGAGWLARPLLQWPREALCAYARRQHLDWVEDASNHDKGIDRNLLRQEVIPVLRRRWPAVSRVLARTAGHCAEAQALLQALAEQDRMAACASSAALSVARLIELDPLRRRNLLRTWIAGCGFTTPDARHLERIGTEVLTAGPDRMPIVRWSGAEIRRYRDLLYVLPPLLDPQPRACLDWNPSDTLELPGGGGILKARPALGLGLDARACTANPMTVRFRRGGERCRLRAGWHRQSLKKLLQARRVPPWVRARLPLIYLGEELAAVADMWVCAGFDAPGGAEGWQIHWQRPVTGWLRE